ncbi:MAG TPA: DNA repair protein [Nitrobacter sp.]|jgi:protein ImuA|nr:DNA repair protein [Nitrobacter sp.]
MTSARTGTLARLRDRIARIETDGPGGMPGRVALGHGEADAVLQGGLARGVLHEVFAEGRHSAAAAGFIAGLAQRVSADRPLLWVRQDFAAVECGALSMPGWRELGLDPRRVVSVHAPDVETALRTSADALACDALGAVVMEVWGETRLLDLVASRRLTLAARASGVAGLLLRVAAAPLPSTAETRWIVRPARSSPGAAWQAWGAPAFDTQLVRNRHGRTGQWIMEWKCDECLFRDASLPRGATHSQSLAAAPADRPDRARVVAFRRAG